MDSARSLVLEAPVAFEGKNVTGVLYLFADLILLTKAVDSKHVKVVYDSEIAVFQFTCQFPEANVYTVDFSGKTYHKQRGVESSQVRFTFVDPQQETAFFQELATMQSRLALESREKYAVQWGNLRVEEPLPHLVRPRAVAIDDDLFIIDCEGQQILKLAGERIIPAARLPETARQVVPTVTGDSIILFTGSTFYQYRPRDGELAEIPITGDFSPRRGTTVTAWERELIVFGGKSLKGHQYFNELIVIRLKSKTAQVQALVPSPPPRWCHSAAVAGGQLIVYGGSANHTAFGDVWLLDLQRRQWRQLAVELSPRRRHAAVTLSGLVAVVGGKDANGIARMFIFDPKNGSVQSMAEFGNAPGAVFCDVAASRERVCLVSGSANKRSKVGVGIYVAVLPDTLQLPVNTWNDIGGGSDAPAVRQRVETGVPKKAKEHLRARLTVSTVPRELPVRELDDEEWREPDRDTGPTGNTIPSPPPARPGPTPDTVAKEPVLERPPTPSSISRPVFAEAPAPVAATIATPKPSEAPAPTSPPISKQQTVEPTVAVPEPIAKTQAAEDPSPPPISRQQATPPVISPVAITKPRDEDRLTAAPLSPIQSRAPPMPSEVLHSGRERSAEVRGREAADDHLELRSMADGESSQNPFVHSEPWAGDASPTPLPLTAGPSRPVMHLLVPVIFAMIVTILMFVAASGIK
jgi:hypothetical protein